MANILIIGSGAFGTALSQPLISNGNNVFFYSKNMDISNDLMNCCHPLFPNVKLLAPKQCFDDYKTAFSNDIDVILLCAPSKSLQSIYNEISPFLKSHMTIINSAKGLNPDSKQGIWSDLFEKNQISKYALIVGPSFAEDVVNKHKTIINVVSDSHDVAKYVISIFNNDNFKLIYYGNEYVASLVSSIKNALAIALGLVTYLDNSMNTQSAFLTIGLSEIQKLISILTGSNESQILDFFGVGDIFLTCSSDMSRNYRFGYEIGKKGLTKTIEESKDNTVEGYKTVEYIHDYIVKYNMNLPLFNSLYDICYNGKNPNDFLDLVWKKL